MIDRARAKAPRPPLLTLPRVTGVLAWAVILAMMIWVLAPTLGHLNAIGSHDWDQMESHRYLAVKTIKRFHQFPFWNPYGCGGFPNWGGFESGTNLVSPWLPFYLTMTLPHAMRIEVWGTALLSAIGAWLLAGRFTSSPAARAFVVAAFAFNGRWTLQLATGHTWHLAYGWTPWVLYYYDRAVGADTMRGAPRARDFVLCAAFLAFMVYAGGIYPLPQTAFLVGLYALALACTMRSLRPVWVFAVTGIVAVGLAAPKLFPVLEVVSRYPRIIESKESMDLGALVQILTAHDQDVNSRPANVNAPWGWHEFGMYVGWTVVLALIVGTLLGRGVRERPLKWVGCFLFLLGFGAFDPHAPWTLMHELPVFKSQHVPSRWQYPGLLLLATVTAAVIERCLRRSGAFRPWLEVAALAAVGWIAYDVGAGARPPITHLFTSPMPATTEVTDTFRTEIRLPADLAYMANYVELSLSAEIANIDTIDCSMFPGLNVFVRDAKGRAVGMGARGRADPLYKGEAYIPDGVGHATIAKWTPNEVTVAVHDAQAGEHVVLNQNWDPGWIAGGSRAINWADQVAAPLHARDADVVFRYRPRLWWPGVLAFTLTVLGIALCYRLRRGGPMPWRDQMIEAMIHRLGITTTGT